MVPTLHPPAPILVAACGNAMAADDAFGPLVAVYLCQRAPRWMEVIDLGMKPAGLLDQLEQRTGLILVDAARPRDERNVSSDLIDLDFFSPARPELLHDGALSSHGLSIAHELELAERLGILPPRIHLLAAEAASTELGQTISDRAQCLIRPAGERALELARCWEQA